MNRFRLFAIQFLIAGSAVSVSLAADPTEGLILFGKDNAALPSGGTELKAIAKIIKESPEDARFGVEGHASDLGPDDVNMTFSKLRAEWVRDQLVNEFGVPAEKLSIIAKGETTPREKVEAGDAVDEKRRKRALNRRVEVKWFEAKDKLVALSEMQEIQMKSRGIDPKKANPGMKKAVDKEKGRSLVSSVNGTAVELFRELAKEAPDKNILLSPHSIGQAMLMTRLGASGATEAELNKVLQLGDKPLKTLISEVVDLRAELEKAGGENTTFNSANALALVGEAGSALPEFEKTLSTDFGAEVIPKADVDSINGWVSDQTKGKIEKLVENLDPESRLVLLNALYFKADWVDQFDKGLTEPGDFTLSDGKKIKVPMMSDQRKVALVVQDDYRALALPYQGGNFVWIAVLPNEDKAEKFLAGGLSEGEWATLVEQGASPARREVRIQIPRFELEDNQNLSAPFQAIGLEEAFTRKADFSKMSEEPLMISQIQHAVKITVNESGSEAAAATAVVMKSRGIALPPQPFILNRPFLFAIAEAKTGSLVVVGRVSTLDGE